MTLSPRPPVVVGVDGSVSSHAALEWAVDEAGRRHLPLHLVSAWISDYSAETTAHLQRSVEDGCRADLESARAQVRTAAPDMEVETSLVNAQPASALIAASRTAQAVVVGSHGLGAVTQAFVGSTCMQLAAHASCPVVVVRKTARDTAGRVVVGVDGSALSADATAYAFDQASRRGLGLTALHAWDASIYTSRLAMTVLVETWDELEVEQAIITSAAIARWRDTYPEVDVETRVVPGRPADVLAEASQHAELLVVGSRGRGGFRGLLLGSVSRSVMHRAACPVVVVRPFPPDPPLSAPADPTRRPS
ncbi:MAG: universal stress protein [Lapillicoccus sp.]